MDHLAESGARAHEGTPARAAGGVDEIFATGGEMGALMRMVDWAATPIGEPARWPQSLRTAISIGLMSRFPILIWWGPELVMLYNDAYAPLIGAKHPQAMGTRGREVFPEIWDVIGPMLGGVVEHGQATWSDDQLLLLKRSGYAEECYFTFSYSPIFDESGVGGVFTAVTETTGRVLSERRMRALRELAARTADAHSERDAIARALGALDAQLADLPFAVLYLLGDDGAYLRQAGAAGISGAALDALGEGVVALGAVEAENDARAGEAWAGWRPALARAVATNMPVPIRRLPEGLIPAGGWEGAPPSEALALPVAQAGQERPYGVLVAGINPRRALDDEYRGFFDLVAGQLAIALASARAYEAERRRAEALSELDRAKTAFFSNVSHEFRTPLTLLLGPLADALNDGTEPLPAGQRERLLVIQRNGLRLLKLVNSLLDFSRIEAGRAQAAYAPVDLAALTVEAASAFRSLVEQAGLRFVVDCPPLAGLSAPVYVDREMWEKIVLNLLSNAFKFTFEGEIAVSLRGEGDAAVLTVRDTGTGIAPEELPRLFERFHRVEGTRSRTYEGSGIGLALVRELARLHGGDVRVESAVGVGSTFTVRIPAGATHLPPERVQIERGPGLGALGAALYAEEAARWLPDVAVGALDRQAIETAGGEQDGRPAERARAGATAAGVRVVVADDNADMRDYLARLLGARYTVTAVPDGQAALDEVRARGTDLVVADVMMPGMDGFALVRALKADPVTATIPVILLSARAGEEATVVGLERGADDYLAKPFSARELLARVEARLEVARLRDEALARARELDAIFEAITDAVFIYDRDGQIVRMNTAARALFGLDAIPDYAEQSPQQRAALISARDEHGQPIPAEATGLYRILRGETLSGPNAPDARLRFADGRQLDVSISGAPLLDATGAVTGAIAVSRDVTERRRLERRTSEALDALLRMAETLVQADTEGEAEGEAARADGLPAATASRVGQRIVELTRRVVNCEVAAIVLLDRDTLRLAPVAVVGLAPDIERQWWQDVPRTPLGEFYRPDVVDRLCAGETVLVDLEAQPLLNGAQYGVRRVLIVPMRIGERIVGLFPIEHRHREAPYTTEEVALVEAIARLAALIVERDRLLAEREESRARILALDEANRRMDEFLGVAGHELRTPLTSIMATIQISERQVARLAQAARANEDRLAEPAERTHELLVRTGRQIKRLDRLVSDLLDVSRISAGHLEMRVELADLCEVVRDAVEAQRASWPERRITLDLPRHGPVEAPLDADRIGQVIANYLTNALKYSAERSPVAVRLRLRDGAARVEVRDHGPGLSPEQMSRVWERFHRVPGVAQRSGSGIGLGLGLYICRNLVERHGGAVGVESAPGAGSTFWFTLPLAGGELRRSIPAQPHERRPSEPGVAGAEDMTEAST